MAQSPQIHLRNTVRWERILKLLRPAKVHCMKLKAGRCPNYGCGEGISSLLFYVFSPRRSCGVNQKWSTPLAVTYTKSGPHHETWSTPPAVVYTQSSPHHETWSTPPMWSTPKVVYITSRWFTPTVVRTKSGPYHEVWFTPKLFTNTGTLVANSVAPIHHPKDLA